jgi:hypothetical protein
MKTYTDGKNFILYREGAEYMLQMCKANDGTWCHCKMTWSELGSRYYETSELTLLLLRGKTLRQLIDETAYPFT